MNGWKHLRIYKSRSLRRKRRRILLAALLLTGLPVLLLCAFVLMRPAWRMLDPQKITDTSQSLHIFDAEGREVSVLYHTENRTDVPLSSLPEHVKNAFIAAEDVRFYSHPGVDIIRIFGAALNDLRAMAYVEGASTITQQLIKLSHLTAEKELTRKLDEAILAYQLEKRFSKDEILELYLNYVYFGSGCYGVEAAARRYFGTGAADLTLAQSALLAGVLKSPRTYSPIRRPEAAVGRRNVILGLMASYGLISDPQASAAKQETFRLSPDPAIGRRGYYIDLALTEACRKLDTDMTSLLQSGCRIYTQMDSRAQTVCEAAFRKDALFPPVEGGRAQAAIVIVDAKTGGVAALVGGRDGDVALAYNHATRIRRQPGSAIKPVLVYAPALEAGYTATSMLLDEQTTFADYAPRNASGAYLGWVTMREAVTRSLNVPAVALFSELGVSYCKNFAARVGIPFDPLDKRLALALGGFTYGVSPYQLAGAYAAFAGNGVYRTPYLIRRMEDRTGAPLYAHRNSGVRVMSSGNAYILTSMLQSVVKSGTAADALAELDLDLAAKTGTVGDSTGNRDLWLCCYNPSYAMVVWMGCDSGHFAPDTGGGTYPAFLLSDVVTQLYRGTTAPRFAVPPTVVRVLLDRHTLQTQHVAALAGTLAPAGETAVEYYVRGTEPAMESGYWSAPAAPRDVTALQTGGSVFIAFTPPSPHLSYRVYREDADGFSVLLTTFSPASVRRIWEDDVTGLSGVYTYYVIPVHPRLTSDGEPLTGAPSDRVAVTVS